MQIRSQKQSKMKISLVIIILVGFLWVSLHPTFVGKNENDDLMNYILVDELVYYDSPQNDQLILENAVYYTV